MLEVVGSFTEFWYRSHISIPVALKSLWMAVSFKIQSCSSYTLLSEFMQLVRTAELDCILEVIV
jgi:hypothetical protein